MSTTITTERVEVPDELLAVLLNAARLTYEYTAAEIGKTDAADTGARTDEFERFAEAHAACVALEDNQGSGMFSSEAVRAAAGWAMHEIRSQFEGDHLTIDEAERLVDHYRLLRGLYAIAS